MKFCILFALACFCPVAFSHKRYIAIPLSALRDGKPDREGNAIVYDINPLQVVSVGPRARSGSTSTAARQTRTTGRSSGERSTARSTSGRHIRTISTGSRQSITTGIPRRTANIITRPPPTGIQISRGAISSGTLRGIATGTQRGSVNIITLTPSAMARFVGSIQPSVPFSPSGAGSIVGNVAYVGSVSPSYIASYVNPIYQPNILDGSSYLSGASYVVNSAMQQPHSNSVYLGWPQYQSYINNQSPYTTNI